MMEMTVRQARILERLLRSEGSVTLAFLAAELGTSTKTVQRDLPQVESWLAEQGIRLLVRPRVGLELAASPSSRQQALARLESLNPKGGLNAEERQHLLLQDLLHDPTGAKLAYFSKRYGVTEATISTDLDRIEPWLKERVLRLLRRPGFGIEVQGSERAFRRAIVDYLRLGRTDEQVYEVLHHLTQHPQDRRQDGFIEQLLHFVDEKTVTRIEGAVRDLDAELDDHMAESAAMGLIVHLSLAVERLRSGEAIRFPPETLSQLRETPEWARAQRLAARVSAELSIEIPDDEVGYITMHLRGARLRSSATAEAEESPDRREALSLARTMVGRAEELLGAPLSEAAGLIHSLAVHLVPAIHRLRLGMEIRNPLLAQVKSEYPALFEASRTICQVLAGYLGTPVPDGEVGYVAMHLGGALERLRSGIRTSYRALLVCPTGVGSSQMLAGRLGYALPEVEVMDVLPALEVLAHIERTGVPPDLILSTVTLDLPEIPVVVVSPLLSAEDVSRVRDLLSALPPTNPGWQRSLPLPERSGKVEKVPAFPAQEPEAMVRRATTIGSILLDLLQTFRLEELAGRDAVAAAVGLLASTEIPHDPAQIEADLHRREALGSTMVSATVQLLHSRTEGLQRPFLGLLQSPARTIVAMLAPAGAAPEVLEVLGAVSVALVEQAGFVRLLRTGTHEQIKRSLGQILQPLMFHPALDKF
jgi:mannitol operon transcriptional antiterminator